MSLGLLQHDFIQKSPWKKVLLQWKTHGNKGCLQPWKKWAIDIKNTRMAICLKKPFYENVLYLTSFSQDLGIFFSFFFFGYIFLRTFFPVILFPETLFTADPNSILGKKVPGIQNTGLHFQRHFSKVLFPGVFQKNFFPGLS